MALRWGRIAGAGLVAEIVPIVLLVLVVAGFGPGDEAAAQAFAERQGRWVGPLGGAAACAAAGWWAARGSARGLATGVAVGGIAAALDLALIVGSGAPFEWLFAASNAGRVLAGALGGARGGQSAPGA